MEYVDSDDAFFVDLDSGEARAMFQGELWSTGSRGAVRIRPNGVDPRLASSKAVGYYYHSAGAISNRLGHDLPRTLRYDICLLVRSASWSLEGFVSRLPRSGGKSGDVAGGMIIKV